MIQVTHKYDHIIDLPHHVSDRYPQMPLMDRAAQFSPFAALTGFEEVLKETEKIVANKEWCKKAEDKNL